MDKVGGSLKGRSPFHIYSPSPLKERGIKGVRMIKNLKLELSTHNITRSSGPY